MSKATLMKHLRMLAALVLFPIPIAWLLLVSMVMIYRTATEGDPDAFVIAGFASAGAVALTFIAYRVLP